MTALVAHKYMPEQMPEAELRATFTAREHTLDFLVKALRDQIGARTLTSYLITGPRGSGKTTLVLMLCLRLREDPELGAAWLPIRFPEELPAITSLRDLFAAALAVMADTGIHGAREWHEKVEREPDERRSRDLAVIAFRRLAEETGRRLVLFVENFDQLFERTSAKEEAVLRRLLMADPFMLIVGTTVRQFEALRSYGRAFFNYFCEVPLRRLDDDQVRALLINRADWDGRPDVAKRARAHQADIQAICRLTGGNPRLTVMLYEILGQGDMTSIVATLRQLVDELTPLLKDVLENQLTNQQRKIVDALMRSGGTATPRALAGVTRLTLNTVTTQLQRLREAELVEARGGGKGRPAHYFVPDQLFSTWYQMRYLRPGRRRVEMFVEVLRTWFQAEERFRTVKSMVAAASGSAGGPLVAAAVAAEYYAASLAGTDHVRVATDLAVETWLKTRNLQEAAFALAELLDVSSEDRHQYEAMAFAALGDWAEEHGHISTAVEALRVAVQRDPTNFEAGLSYGFALARQGDHVSALQCFDELVRAATDPRVRFSALLNRGAARAQQGDVVGAIADYTAVVELEEAPREPVAGALFNRGVARRRQGDTAGAIADYTAVVELEGVSRELVAHALVNRGLARRQQGDTAGAIADFTAVVELEGAPREQVVRALVNRGFARRRQGDTAGAITDYTAVVELQEASREQVARALVNRGVARGQQGDTAGAIVDYTAVVELDGAPREQVVRALGNRGLARRQQGDTAGAIADYTAVVELEGAPREQVVRALGNRGLVRTRQGDTAGAIADYTAVVELAGASHEQVARALVNRGFARGQQSDTAREIADYTAVIDLKGAPHEQVARALVNRGVVRGQQGDMAGAIADYTAVVEMEGAPREGAARALLNRGLVRRLQGDTVGEIADYTAVVELQGAPREQVARALVVRGVARGQQGDSPGAIEDLSAVIESVEFEPELRATALIGRAWMRASLAQTDQAFDDAITVCEGASYSPRIRMAASPLALVASQSEERLERVLSAVRELVVSLAPEQRRDAVLELLSVLSSPRTAGVWSRVWRAIIRDQPQELVSSLSFFDAIVDVLEGHDWSTLDPLPPEQREFALEILRKLGRPTETGSDANHTLVKESEAR
jgi:tetratricopeptide (TPR) repeat protein/DNA-binding transcriptional ArsR family regulator